MLECQVGMQSDTQARKAQAILLSLPDSAASTRHAGGMQLFIADKRGL